MCLRYMCDLHVYLYLPHRHITQHHSSTSQKDLIEGCEEWESLCPMLLEKLSRTGDDKIDHCLACGKDVHIVETYDELEEKV